MSSSSTHKTIWEILVSQKTLSLLSLLLIVAMLLPLVGIALYNYPGDDDFNFTLPATRAWAETGSLWETLKAVWEKTGGIVLADDSGLEIDYLNKEPGIYSARYMGEDTSYDIKNQNLIDRLAGVEGAERSARFVCAIAAVFPDGTRSGQRNNGRQNWF